MIRIIVRTDDAQMAANVGGSVHETFRTFDVHLPELEAYLSEKNLYVERRAIGIEMLPAPGVKGMHAQSVRPTDADVSAPRKPQEGGEK